MIAEKLKKNAKAIFFVLDVALIVFAVYLSFILRFDGVIPAGKYENFKYFSLLAAAITPLIFYFFGLYRISWSYVSLTDLPNIAKGIISSGFLLGTALYIFRFYQPFEGFPRSVIFLYILLLFPLIGGLRFSKRIYWQIIRGEGIGGERKSLQSLLDNQPIKPPSTILITGGAGYIGSVLAEELLEKGYKVVVFDKLLFGSAPIERLMSNPNFRLVKGDILEEKPLQETLLGVDAVVHLAAIVGEAACTSKKETAIKTNYLATVRLARLCKFYRIKRFVYASTCSAYGQVEEGDIMEEKSFAKPVDFYGETKIYAEREIAKLVDDNFNPTILRFSTVYGLSPRMRFDLVVNTFVKNAVKDKEILIFKGNQWRPLIHVRDVARAVIKVIDSPLSKSGRQIFNVGDDRENYTIFQLGDIIKKHLPQTEIKIVDSAGDSRSYKVSFAKIKKVLGFETELSVEDGVLEIKKAFEKGEFKDPTERIYYNHLV